MSGTQAKTFEKHKKYSSRGLTIIIILKKKLTISQSIGFSDSTLVDPRYVSLRTVSSKKEINRSLLSQKAFYGHSSANGLKADKYSKTIHFSIAIEILSEDLWKKLW